MKENNKSKFTLIDDSGVEREYEMLFTFDSDETKKSYMVYTDHDKDADGKEKVYASIFDPNGLDKNIYPIESEKEWLTICNILNKLIKNDLTASIYVKLNKVTNLQAGTYTLNDDLSLKEILTKFQKGDVLKDEITMTFVEGKRLTYFAEVITNNTDYTKEEVLKVASDKTFLEDLINKYWFVTNDILNSKIYYPLEGYLFPDTYSFKKDASIEGILTTLVASLGKKLEPYKTEIVASKFSVHEILTLASIVELEGANSNDRAGVAGVFYNRINAGWTLGSDVTTYYAEQKGFDEELTMNAYNSCNAYNTRGTCFTGLPVGPICSSGLESLKATIEPESGNYYYFVADKNKKTYFMSTSTEFQQKINELKRDNLWYTYW